MPKQQDIAKALGIEPPLVTRYKRKGMPIDSIEGALAWKAANVRPRAVSGSPKKKPVVKRAAGKRGRAPVNHYQDARTRSAIAEAQDREFDLLERRQILVSREKVRAEIARRLAGLRDSLLQIPARLQSVLAAETDDAKCHDILQDELYLVLAQFTDPA